MDTEKKTLSWYISNAIWIVLEHTLPQKAFLSLRYHQIFGKWIDWKNPVSFTEKLQWLKVYGYKPEHTKMVDKVEAKLYVANIIGIEHIIPTLKVWNNANEIAIDSLPDQFVIKTNHDSGTVMVCDKRKGVKADIVISSFRKALRKNYYLIGRETPYKFVQRKVFAEAFLDSGSEEEIRDYKFFCFNGEPKLFKINFDRSTNFSANYFDTEMNILPFGEVWPAPDYSKKCEKPDNFDEMLEICRKLSANEPFLRVDLYNISGKIYFGELTFFPTSGFGPFTDPEWDIKLGNMIQLTPNN